MQTSPTHEEFFQSIRIQIHRLRKAGHQAAADAIQDGFSALNGLTDGWAIFMEAIERAIEMVGAKLPHDQVEELQSILSSVRELVYR
jgi:hypothetical protein